MIKDYKGKVAVVTGGASGMGRAFVERCCREGMKVVVADIDEVVLQRTEQELRAEYSDVMCAVVNVSKLEDIQMLAEKTIDQYGAVHMLFNNAGVGANPSVAHSSIKDWQWVLDIDLWGVIYGINVFLPRMLEQNEGYIINTSSGAGVTPIQAAYGTAKVGVTAISEMLALELKGMGSEVRVSAVFPGIVNTDIVNSGRHRPEEMKNPDVTFTPEMQKRMEARRNWALDTYSNAEAMLPETVADIVFYAIERDTLFIFTDIADGIGVEKRAEKMLEDLKVLEEFAEKSDLPKHIFRHKNLVGGLTHKYDILKK